MGWQSLGKVTATAGAPVAITTNVPASGAFGLTQATYECQTILIQALSTNTGKVYVGDNANFNKSGSGLNGLLAVLPVPTANSIPSVSVTVPVLPAGLNAGSVYIDVDNSGEGVIASVVTG